MLCPRRFRFSELDVNPSSHRSWAGLVNSDVIRAPQCSILVSDWMARGRSCGGGESSKRKARYARESGVDTFSKHLSRPERTDQEDAERNHTVRCERSGSASETRLLPKADYLPRKKRIIAREASGPAGSA